MHKHFIAAAVLVLTSTGSFAAQEFYVVKEAKGQGCEITQEKPESTNMIGTKAYSTRQEAKDAKRAAPECDDTARKAKPQAQ